MWSDETLLSGRAQFRPEAFPALLRLQEVGLGDAGSYRCRVDFTEAPTRNTLINLTVIGEFGERSWKIYCIVVPLFKDRTHSVVLSREREEEDSKNSPRIFPL